MYKLFFPRKAVEEGIWTRWWEHAGVRTDEHAARLEQTFVWRRIRKYLRVGARVLEAGCGLGDWVRFFQMKGLDAVGTDNCAPVIEKARRNYPGSEFILGEITDLRFPADSFDAVVSWGVLEHFEDGAGQALREFARVLRPGGYLFVTVPHLNRWFRLVGRRREGGEGDANGRPLRSGPSERSFSEDDLRSPGIISGLPVYRESAVFHEYVMYPRDLQGMLSQSSELEILDITPFDVRASFVLPADVVVRILYKTIWPRRAVRAVERILGPVLPASWFGATLFAVCRKRRDERP